ncbi:MAG: hypothetical protein KDC13_05110 [Bacteroidetes bacterium]|nr:hypothetical protein [Bacteroidota bacterium]
MKPVNSAIFPGTIYFTMFILMVMYHQTGLAVMLFGMSPLVILLMVYKVLKGGAYPKNMHWDESSPESMYEHY